MGPNDKKTSLLEEEEALMDDTYIDSLIAIYTNPNAGEDDDEDNYLADELY